MSGGYSEILAAQRSEATASYGSQVGVPNMSSDFLTMLADFWIGVGESPSGAGTTSWLGASPVQVYTNLLRASKAEGGGYLIVPGSIARGVWEDCAAIADWADPSAEPGAIASLQNSLGDLGASIKQTLGDAGKTVLLFATVGIVGYLLLKKELKL